MQSHSIEIKPIDSRCRYWAKLIRAEQPIARPENVNSATDIPGIYKQLGQEELLPGDALFEGEANHHRRTDRGWSYWLTVVTTDGTLLRFESGFGAQRKQLKSQGLPAELLKGSGDVAAMVRILHGIRAGMTIIPD